MNEKPSLKRYRSSYKFLQDYYSYCKETQNSFSYETWAQNIGFEDRNYLRLVVSGKRPISQKLEELFLNAFNFDVSEKHYFTALINFTQSKTEEQRKVFETQLLRLLDAGVEQTEIKSHFDFLANPLLPKLKTLLSFSDIPKSIEKLSLILDVEDVEVAEGLKTLENLGFARAEVQPSGKMHWKSAERSWKVPTEFKDLGLREFYRNALEQAKKAIDFPVDDRRFSTLFLAMNPQEYQDFLKDFEVFVQERLKKHDVDEFENRRLFQINFNFFAVTANPTK